MCFSATASLIAGATTAGIGVATVKNIKSKRQIPLASIPFLFGVQQFIEGGIWLSFNMPMLNLVLTYVYIFYSHIWWPFFIPFAIFMVEDHKIRKKILFFYMVIGICIGVYFTAFTLTGPVSSSIMNNSIGYTCNYYNLEIVLLFYMLTTCICCFISSHKMIRVFGGATLLSSFVAYHFYIYVFTSVWCFFSAVLSVILYLHFKEEYKIGDYINSAFKKMKSSFDILK
ncbi:DUF6629 family protein [Patescibacteria group bacterium]